MGRLKGARVHNNHGLLKRCGCSRKRWSACAHPWWFNFCFRKTDYRFNLNEHVGVALGAALSRTEAEAWRDRLRAQIREGTFDAAPTPPPSAPDQKRLRDVGAAIIEAWRNEPERRRHRITVLEKQLAVICRTVLGDQPFGDVRVNDIGREHLNQFRDARRRVFREREAQQRERRQKMLAGEAKLPVVTEIPLARRGEVGINRSLETVRAAINFAIDQGWFKGENPFTRYSRKVMAKEQPRTRRLQPDEVLANA